MTEPLTPPDAAGVPVVVYAAKSDRDEHDSTGSQIEQIVERVKQLGGRWLYAEPFAEDRVSGYKRSRGPQLEAALAAARRAADEHGEAELWVYITSRLARGSGRKSEARSYTLLWAQLQADGVQVRSVSDDEFALNPALVGIASTQAHKFSVDMGANIRKAKRRQFERGQPLGGPIPDGYLGEVYIDPDGRARKRRIVDPQRAPVIRLIFDLADDGLAPKSIAQRLNRDGLRTAAGRPWTRRRIQDTLSNPHYRGHVARGRSTPGAAVESAPGPFEALVDDELFERVQAKVAARDRAQHADRTPGRPGSRHLLWGLARCAQCGSRIHGSVSPYVRKADGGQKRTYRCGEVHAQTGLCDQPIFDGETLDAAVLGYLHFTLDAFRGWLRAVGSAHEARRQALVGAVASARSARDALAQEVEQLDEQIAALLAEGDAATARGAGRALERREAALAHAEEHLRRAQQALDAEPGGPAGREPWLDQIVALHAAVRGGRDGTSALLDVNAGLREHFEAFALAHVDGGVLVTPVPRTDRPALPPSALAAAPSRRGAEFVVVKPRQAGAYRLVTGRPPFRVTPRWPARGPRKDAGADDKEAALAKSANAHA